jgi:hypothetical protein
MGGEALVWGIKINFWVNMSLSSIKNVCGHTLLLILSHQYQCPVHADPLANHFVVDGNDPIYDGSEIDGKCILGGWKSMSHIFKQCGCQHVLID